MAKAEKTRYPALRIIAAWYKLFGYVVGVVLVVAGFITMFQDGGRTPGALLTLGGIVFIIISVATAETIKALLDTESNTRSSAESLLRLVEMQSKPTRASAASTKPVTRPPAPTQKASSDQAKTIRNLIRNLHSDGQTPEQIAEELRKEAMPTLDGSPYWTAQAVDAVLREQ